MMNSIRICVLVVAFSTLAAWARDPAPERNAVRFYLPGEQETPKDRTDSAAGNDESLNIAASVPATISLNGDWEFYYDGVSEGKRRGISYAMKEVVPELPAEESYETTMPVPGYWDDHLANLRGTSWWFWAQFNTNYRKIEFPMGSKFVPPFANLGYLVGTGYYRKALYLPEGLANKKISLSIGGVVEKAALYINGSRVGEKTDYLTPGEVDLSGSVRAGKNELIIAVTNRDTFARGAPTSCAIDGYQGFTGGIYGEVSLKISQTPRIKDLYVRADGDNVRWETETDAYVDDELLQWSVKDAESGDEVLKGELSPPKSGLITWDSPSAQMQRWSESNPKLYVVEVRSVVAGKTMDVCQQKFGLRTMSVRDKNICLNDKAVMLRGICDSWYYPETTTAPLDPRAYIEMIKKYKELGFNWIRFHTSMPRQEYLDAADKLGMFIQVESPRGSDEQTWVNILKAARNHPSVILCCVSNEALMDDAMIATVTQRHDVMKQLMPDALFSPMEALRGVEYGAGRQDFEPGAVDEPFLHNPARLALLKPITDVFEPTGWGHFSFNSAATADASGINDNLNLFERPCVLHEVGIHGTYLDLRLTGRYRGTRIGTELFDAVRRYLDENQLLSKADLYYRNSCRWAQLARKHAVERARLCDNVKGYDLLGAVDIHWMFCGYTCGIMNEFLELKPGESAQDVLNYNGESVLLLNLDTHRVFFAGDRFQVPLFASLYGEEPCVKGTLYWSVKDETGKILSSNAIPVDRLPAGKLSQVTDVQFQFPRISRSTKLRITTRLLSSTYDLENEWSVWAFPRCDFNGLNFSADQETAERLKISSQSRTTKPPQDALRVTSNLTSEQVEFLKSGGRVLLLGTAPFKNGPASFQVAAAGRVIGNQATIIAEHPLFSGFAHDGFCDWQFYQMLNDSHLVVFDDKRIPFEPILEMASSYKLLKRQAAIFELRVGEGSLLVCTLNLKIDDPAGQFLLHNLIQYSSSNQFHPSTEVDPAVIESLLVKESHK